MVGISVSFLGLDSVFVRCLESALFGAWLCVCESIGLDSVNALNSVPPRLRVRKSARNCVDSAPLGLCIFYFSESPRCIL